MKVVHVITCLDDGGAEAVLYRLVCGLPQVDHVVVSLRGIGKYGEYLISNGIPVINLDMTSPLRIASAVFRLARIIRKLTPDVVQTWMYHSDFVGGIAARLAGVRNVVWGLHNSMVALGDNTMPRFALIRLNAILSHILPRGVVSCSRAAFHAHVRIGYEKNRIRIVPNGYPIDLFRPDKSARLAVRRELGVEDEILLGMVARLDPQKDHRNLLDALAIFKRDHNFRCLLVGKGLDRRSKLRDEIVSRGLEAHVLLLGQRSDIADIMNALDIFCLSSAYAEAFPNVLCEAMACGIPCVTTNVGDSAFIVGSTGWVVPPRSAEDYSNSLKLAVQSFGDSQRKADARRRIVENFSVDAMASGYLAAWNEGWCE